MSTAKTDDGEEVVVEDGGSDDGAAEPKPTPQAKETTAPPRSAASIRGVTPVPGVAGAKPPPGGLARRWSATPPRGRRVTPPMSGKKPPPAVGVRRLTPAPDDRGMTPSPSADMPLEERVLEMEAEKKSLWDRLLRAIADLDNYRKRTKKDLVEAADKGREKLLHEILPVADNLERAIGQATEKGGSSALLDGVRMVHRQLMLAFERFEIKPYDSVGKTFDPEVHEALQQDDTSEAEIGKIVQELQRGYTQAGRVIRPALVVVSSGKLAKSGGKDNDQV